jgi:steroid delta-isomerase-like uncharacterized protein
MATVDHSDPKGKRALDAPASFPFEDIEGAPTSLDVPGYQEALDRLCAAFENKALVYRWYEDGLAQGDMVTIDTLISSDFVGYALGGNVTARGSAGVKELVCWYHDIFADIQITVDDMIAEGEKLVVRTTHRGTYQGGWRGIPGTDQRVTIRVMTIYHITDGQICHAWIEFSDLDALGQLNALPQPVVFDDEGGPLTWQGVE